MHSIAATEEHGNTGAEHADEAALAKELDAGIEVPAEVDTKLPPATMEAIYTTVRQALVERYQAMKLQARLNQKVGNDGLAAPLEEEAKKALRMIAALDRERSGLA
jgi:hypothetical protein